VAVHSERHTLDQLFAAAQSRIERLHPPGAFAAMQEGALLIDIRQVTDRERDGIVPGSLHIPRTVLEWRLDVDSDSRSPYVGGLDERILVLCDHGYSSVFAADMLVQLGFARAGDVIGGYEAWQAAGLPTATAPTRRLAPGECAGMSPPDR
jgi:rhodanese-related sulfurtransferase